MDRVRRWRIHGNFGESGPPSVEISGAAGPAATSHRSQARPVLGKFLRHRILALNSCGLVHRANSNHPEPPLRSDPFAGRNPRFGARCGCQTHTSV